MFNAQIMNNLNHKPYDSITKASKDELTYHERPRKQTTSKVKESRKIK